jgi:hypothetical protein
MGHGRPWAGRRVGQAHPWAEGRQRPGSKVLWGLPNDAGKARPHRINVLPLL